VQRRRNAYPCIAVYERGYRQRAAAVMLQNQWPGRSVLSVRTASPTPNTTQRGVAIIISSVVLIKSSPTRGRQTSAAVSIQPVSSVAEATKPSGTSAISEANTAAAPTQEIVNRLLRQSGVTWERSIATDASARSSGCPPRWSIGSQKPGLGHELNDFLAVELRDVDLRRIQVVQRCEPGIGGLALAHDIFVGVFVGVAILQDGLPPHGQSPI
jgi:hypothetical protein